MVQYPGYKSLSVELVGMGTPVETISSGTVVTNMVFNNRTGGVATFSGTGASAEDTEDFVVVVAATDSRTLPETFYCAGQVNFVAPAGCQISYRYSTTR